MEAPDRISVVGIRQWLGDGEIGRRMEQHRTLDSTNTRAKAIPATGVPSCYLVIAESQTGGKGRMALPAGAELRLSPWKTSVWSTFIPIHHCLSSL